MKIGSLFDGAGTFPFAAQQYGVHAAWASEIEDFPIKVTSKNLPQMKHLGDITKINGAEIEPVDIITFGSPCTRLSVAGKHDGFEIKFKCEDKHGKSHFEKSIRAIDKYQYVYEEICPICGAKLEETNESALFFHATRIISEMLEVTNGKYPKIAVWENVPGAFSSNGGEDFRAVIEELCKIKGSETIIPRPKNGKWSDSGFVLGGGFSFAWRILDAQFWGVPQRRRRIYAVLDIGGDCAGKILFERNGLSRNFEESRKAWKGITRNSAYCTYTTRKCFDARGNGNGEIAPTIVGNHNDRITDYSAVVVEGLDVYNQSLTGDKSMTLTCAATDPHHIPCIIAFNALQDPVPNEKVSPCVSAGNSKTGQASIAVLVYGKGTRPHNAEEEQKWIENCKVANCLNTNDMSEARTNELVICAEIGSATRTGGHIWENLCGTLRANPGDNLPIFCLATQQGGAEIGKNLCPTITAAAGMSGNNQPVICYALDRASFNQGENAQYNFEISDEGINSTIVAKGPSAVCYGVPLGFRAENTKLYKETATTICNGTNPGHHQGVVIPIQTIYKVRRVTPTECARLQGMPDWWCDDIPHTDSAEYKMWGNGMALPCAMFVMENVVRILRERLLAEVLL